MNTIVKTFAAMVMILFILPNTFGQESKRAIAQEKKEKIEALKISFITTELELTSEESEKFWPIYNEMEAKIKAEKRARRTLEKELREQHATLSDADNKTKVLAIFESEQKEIAIKRDYFTKIGDKIGYTKSTKLLSLEQKFKRELMSQLGKDRKGAGDRPHGNQGK